MLRFYESQCLISSRRNAGNQRRYASDVLRRVSAIKVAQRFGMTVDCFWSAVDGDQRYISVEGTELGSCNPT